MQESTFTNYDQLPLFLNANTVAQVLGVSISSAYELMHEMGFPALRIGSRIVVPKEKFRRWVETRAGGDACCTSAGPSGRQPNITTSSPTKSLISDSALTRSPSTITFCAARIAEPTSAIPATAPSERRCS